MQIKQFEDENLAHFSYAIVSDCEKKVIFVDPARNVQPYLEYAEKEGLTIAGVIETHPHADFVSSHLELHDTTGAQIYVSKLVKAEYPFRAFDEGGVITLGKIKLTALHTPGHSPDSICIVLHHDGKDKAVFTGDTLLIGDCGRPDLREDIKDKSSDREHLAGAMYESLGTKLKPLADEVVVYPAHGAGSLCGKVTSKAKDSTIGKEKKENWAMQEQSKEQFVSKLIEELPFTPAYFSYDVMLNKKGAAPLKKSVSKVIKVADIKTSDDVQHLNKDIWIIDARNESDFKDGHLEHSLNIVGSEKFETWLGSMIKPDEQFYLTAENEERLNELIERTAAIGYESKIAAAFVIAFEPVKEEKLDVDDFKKHQDEFTIVDVRNENEAKERKAFANSINIPLPKLRQQYEKIPIDKPLVVHCAGGYRSAIASSFLQTKLRQKNKVLDLGNHIKEFLK